MMTNTEHLIQIQTRLERIERLLKKENEDDTLMTISEASNYSRLSASTLRRAVGLGDLQVLNGGGHVGGRGGKIIFKKSTLTRWLEGS